MKYTFLQSLIPEGEHFDESAVVNEGGWLSVKHLDLINSKGVEMQSAVATMTQTIADNKIALDNLVGAHATEVSGLTATIGERDAAIGTLNTTVADKEATIGTLNSTIADLQEQVKTLGGQSSGTGTTLSTAADETTDETPAPVAGSLPRYDSADHPANKGADQFLSSKKSTENVRF